jgi:hypothetical protein
MTLQNWGQRTIVIIPEQGGGASIGTTSIL